MTLNETRVTSQGPDSIGETALRRQRRRGRDPVTPTARPPADGRARARRFRPPLPGDPTIPRPARPGGGPDSGAWVRIIVKTRAKALPRRHPGLVGPLVPGAVVQGVGPPCRRRVSTANVGAAVGLRFADPTDGGMLVRDADAAAAIAGFAVNRGHPTRVPIDAWGLMFTIHLCQGLTCTTLTDTGPGTLHKPC